MHLYTLAQLIGLGVLWAVKSTALALFFPFFVVAMIPYRMLLGCFFTPRELNAVRPRTRKTPSIRAKTCLTEFNIFSWTAPRPDK